MKHFVLFATLLFHFACFGQSQSFDDVVNYYNREKNFNGVVLVATNGQIDYLSGVGISNREAGVKMNSKTKFKIASVTKTFTAVLVLQLVQQGKIDINAKIGTYFPTYKGEAKDKVTIQQLLTYSSGIEESVANLGMKPYQNLMTLDQFIDTYCSGKLIAKPGEKSSYSNTEYTILHKIIENVSKKSYSTLLQEAILTPLKMENTGLLSSTEILPGLTSSYTLPDSSNQLTTDEPYFIDNYFGSAAMYSTAEDLFKFNNALVNNRLLNEATSKLFFQPVKNMGGATLGGVWYADGYGTFGTPFFYRTGGLLGSCSNWIYSFNDKKTFMVFNNTNGTNLYEMSEQLYLVSKGQKATVPMDTLLKTKEKTVNLDSVKGKWILDLRPEPNSQPYLKEFILTPTTGRGFDGEFYGTKFTGGIFNTDWDRIYFAFTTGDKENTYFHSGYIVGDKIYGISYCEGRKFTSHWTGFKK